MYNFRAKAQEAITLSPVMTNRTKVKNVTGKVHISDFDIVPDAKSKKMYAVCAISATEFMNGGYMLTKIFSSIVDDFGGDITTAREEFVSAGGLDVVITRTMTRDGNNFVNVEVL